MRSLPQYAIDEIAAAYESALSTDSGYSTRVGEHAILIMVLEKWGLSAGDVREAYRTAERVIYNGAPQ